MTCPAYYLQLLAVVLISHMITGCATTPALHVIGVYEGQPPSGVDDVEKEVVVTLGDDSKPVVLALTAYDRTLWKLDLKTGVKLIKVILGGYHSQRVVGISAETPVETYTYDPSPCEQCWQGTGYFYSYEQPPERLKDITGLRVTSFQGRYQAAEFSILPAIKIRQ